MSTGALNALAILSALLLGLALLTGLFALVVSLAERSRVTVRKWLALAWLATLLVPAVATGIAIAVTSILAGLPQSSAFAISANMAVVVSIVTGLAAFLVTMVVLAWLTGRMVLHPLAAMSEAARQIAAGDLDIVLPSPALAEVADVAEAFRSMSAGLRRSIERQADVEQQRRLFISAIAHDLRTPLFSLRGYLEGLDRGLADTPERAAHYLAVSRQQADNLERLVSDLFTYTRLEFLEQTPQCAPVDLGALLCRTVEALRPRATHNGLTLVASGPAGCVVEADAHLLTRAVENLLDNALRYTPPGGSISVCWEPAISGCRFLVADSGPGIAAADLPHIFDALYRGEASRNRGTGGAGLGLAIARSILVAHGGDLSVTNRPEGGAELEGRLPSIALRPR